MADTDVDIAGRLADTLQDALQLLRDGAYADGAMPLAPVPDETLLAQCLAMCEQHQARPPEPVRLLHHFACTGGTLLSKCVATMPNVQLLSEVDPLSPHQFNPAKPRFAPTDMAGLMRQSTRGTNERMLIDLFQLQLPVIHAEAVGAGQRLVLRDHVHSHFCLGDRVPQRPSLREMVAAVLPVLALLTVRHPLDSFASLSRNQWLHFSPATLDEYCRRYLSFLDAHDGVPRIRYEDFTDDPQAVMQQICGHLDLAYTDTFPELFSVIRITGDSGRSGATIGKRTRLQVAVALQAEADASEAYHRLVHRLGYGAIAAELTVS